MECSLQPNHNDSLMIGSLTQPPAFGAKIHLELERWRKLWEQQENKTTVQLCSTTMPNKRKTII